MMIVILLFAVAVICSDLNAPVLQQPSGGMPEGMEFCNQGRIKKLCHKNVFQPTAVKGPVALSFCPGTLKKLCPIKPVALKFSSGPVTSIPVGWKVCRDNLGLCPVRGYSTRRRPSRPSYPENRRHSSFPLDSRVGRPSKRPIFFPSAFPTHHNKGLVPCKYRAGMCFPEKDDDDDYSSMPLDSRVGRPSKTPISFPSSFPTHHNRGLVPCKYRAGLCFPDEDDNDSSNESGFVEARVISSNRGMVPCKDRMGMCPPDN